MGHTATPKDGPASACPWLIHPLRRPSSRFLYVRPDKVLFNCKGERGRAL